jgi:hypothetical protein
MSLGAFFEAVDELPASLRPGGIYFVKRAGGELDVVVADLAGNPVAQRKPNLQMTFHSTGINLPAGQEFGRHFTTEELQLDALLSGAVSSVPAANDAEISVMRGADLVARYTFPSGQSQAVVQIIMPTVPARNLLIFRTPLVQDASLAGVTGTLGARRL